MEAAGDVVVKAIVGLEHSGHRRRRRDLDPLERALLESGGECGLLADNQVGDFTRGPRFRVGPVIRPLGIRERTFLVAAASFSQNFRNSAF